MMPQVSVLMPVRDGARWLAEAIASVQRQTLSDFELIIVDDGSSDGSPRISRDSAAADVRIRLVRQDRLGLIAALNTGLAFCRGRLIARLDADDRAHPERLQRQVQFFNQNPNIGLLGSWAQRIDEQGHPSGTIEPEADPDRLARGLLRGNPVLHSSVMLRADVLAKVGRYRTAFEGAEDYDLWLRMAEVSGIAILPERLVDYRWHPANVSNRLPVRQLFSTRLAQAAARARRTGECDPIADIQSPPDWHVFALDPASPIRPLARLYCFLELAEQSRASQADISRIDLSVLKKITLTHAERKAAQLALLNLLKRGEACGRLRAAMIWQFARLHPARALRLTFGAGREP